MAPQIPRVHAGNRFFETPDGKPFFWLADTAWELFHRLTKEEAEHYLTTRAKQGFNVIQAVLLAEMDGLNTPNAHGHRPFLNNDPLHPDPSGYWEHADWVVNRANELGLYMALLPTWGDKINKDWGAGPVIFTEENARLYGNWVAERFHQPNVLWINGGDRDPKDKQSVWHALAKGLREAEKCRRLMTYHPPGGTSSSKWFHDADWLDFSMMQSGHWDFGMRADLMIEGDYQLSKTKPTLDGEPNYENHRPFKGEFTLPYLSAFDVRRASYWSVFAGGCGVTYGCHAIWQMASERYAPINFPLGTWKQSLSLPGALQVVHLKNLMLSRPYFSRIPDQSLILEGLGDKPDMTARATRDAEGTCAMIYLPGPRPLKLDLAKLQAPLAAWWFDPRTGEVQETPIADVFHAPTAEDWVLVIDSKSAGYGKPGKVIA